MSYTISDIRKIVEVQRAFFRSGTTLDVSWRLKQLRKLRDAVIAHEAEFEEALAGEYRSRVVFGGKELFCPLLPVVPFKDAEVDKVLDVIESREHPLAMYIFTKNIRWAEKTMRTLQPPTEGTPLP